MLAGARRLLESPQLPAMIVELNGSGRRYRIKDADVVVRLQELGFDAYRYDPLTRPLSPLKKWNPGSSNVIYIRDPNRIANLVATAPRYWIAQILNTIF